MVHKYLSIIIFLVFSSSSIFAQKGQIQGLVTDAKTGETLAGVNINLKGEKINTVSEKDGSFVFANLDSGTYNLEFIMVQLEAGCE